MIDATLIQKIHELATNSMPTIEIDQYTKAARMADGTLANFKRPDTPHSNLVFSLTDLVKNTLQGDKNQAEIYYSRKGIRGFHGKDRRDSVTMRLTKSKAFAQLEKWDEKPEQIKQDELFRLLKTTFRNCCDDTLERTVKSIKWTMGNSGDATVRQGSVSMNKSIIAEMTGAEDLNKIEYVNFSVPVFNELPSVKATIECHIRPIPDQQMFSVIPTGGHIEIAYREAENAMRLVIDSSNDKAAPIPVYCGYAEADNIFAVELD